MHKNIAKVIAGCAIVGIVEREAIQFCSAGHTEFAKQTLEAGPIGAAVAALKEIGVSILEDGKDAVRAAVPSLSTNCKIPVVDCSVHCRAEFR